MIKSLILFGPEIDGVRIPRRDLHFGVNGSQFGRLCSALPAKCYPLDVRNTPTRVIAKPANILALSGSENIAQAQSMVTSWLRSDRRAPRAPKPVCRECRLLLSKI